MKYIRNEKGIALMMALILSLVALAIISALIYFVTQGTLISGFQKRYQTAQETAQGGVEFMTGEIIEKAISGASLSSLGSYGGMMAIGVTDACFSTKLTQQTSNWGACSSTLDPKDFPDITLTFLGAAPQPNFIAYAKIVDTLGDTSGGSPAGNSDTSGLYLEGQGVAESGSGMVTPQHIPYMYRIEVQGERSTNPDERANFSVLYAY